MRKYLSLTSPHHAGVSLCIILFCNLTVVGQHVSLAQNLSQGPNAYSLPQQPVSASMGVPLPHAGVPVVTSPGYGNYSPPQPRNNVASQRHVPNQHAPAMQSISTGGVTTTPMIVPNQYLNAGQLTRPGYSGREALAAARRAENQGNNAEAKRCYEIALQSAPNDRLTLLSYARMMHRVGQFEGSIALYNRLLGVYPNDVVVMNDLSLCYARQGNMQRALTLLAGAVSLQPESKRYRNNIAKLLIEVNRTAEAFSHLEYAHGGAIAHFNLGSMLHQRGRDDEALKYLRAAVEMDPSLSPAINLLASLEKPAVVGQLDRLPAAENLVSAEVSERTRDAAPMQLATPLAKQRWEPGSVRLQSAEMSANEPVSEGIKWADGDEAIDEHVTSAAPLPFESPIRRYTRPQADSIQSFLDRQASER